MRNIVLATTMVLSAGCLRINSDRVTTQGIQAEFTVTGKGDGKAHVEGQLRAGAYYLHLSEGDSLTVDDGSGPGVLVEEIDALKRTSFAADLGTDMPGTTLTIAFDRATEASAPATTVQLPSRFDIVSSASTGDAVFVAWDSRPEPGETMEWRQTGCETSGASSGQILSGDRNLWISLASTDPDSSMFCFATVTISRVREGALDSAFDTGFVRARQEREVTVLVVR